MSITISTAEQIYKSPHNSSTAKFLYSFPKSHRFSDMSRSGSLDKFYTLPESKSKRSTSFGYGTKYDFTAHVKNFPPPGHYSNVDAMYKFKKHGLSIAPGRDVVKFNDFLAIGAKGTPGPTAYKPEGYRKLNPFAFTLRSRNEKMLKDNGVPGPGYYPLDPIINGTGFHVNSKYRSFNPKIIKSPEKEHNNTDNGVPGPGKYDWRVITENGSKAVLSTKKSINNFKFPATKKGWLKSASDSKT